MNSLPTLSLTASVMVLLLYPVLYILIRRCRLFRFNRFCIITVMALVVLLSVILSFRNDAMPDTDYPADANIARTILPTFEVEDSGVSSIMHVGITDIIPWIIIAYWSGVLLLGARLVWAYIQLRNIIRQSEKSTDGKIVFCTHSAPRISPFNWGKYIVLPAGEDDKAILLHEKAHTRNVHWIDVLFADVFCIFLWYNPFAWMIKNIMKLNHEYEADSAVINSDIDILDYQKLLITKAVGRRLYAPVNNFAMDRRSFRNRVLVMGKPKSANGAKWIITASIPSFVLALAANTAPVSTRILNAVSDYQLFGRSQSESAVEHPSHDIVTEISKQRGVVEIYKILPSPLTDPEPLRRQFQVSFEAADKDFLPDKLLVRIEVDENGRIVSATSDNDDNRVVRLAIDEATNGIQFEIVKDKERNIRTKFALPISLKEF